MEDMAIDMLESYEKALSIKLFDAEKPDTREAIYQLQISLLIPLLSYYYKVQNQIKYLLGGEDKVQEGSAVAPHLHGMMRLTFGIIKSGIYLDERVGCWWKVLSNTLGYLKTQNPNKNALQSMASMLSKQIPLRTNQPLQCLEILKLVILIQPYVESNHNVQFEVLKNVSDCLIETCKDLLERMNPQDSGILIESLPQVYQTALIDLALLIPTSSSSIIDNFGGDQNESSTDYLPLDIILLKNRQLVNNIDMNSILIKFKDELEYMVLQILNDEPEEYGPVITQFEFFILDVVYQRILQNNLLEESISVQLLSVILKSLDCQLLGTLLDYSKSRIFELLDFLINISWSLFSDPNYKYCFKMHRCLHCGSIGETWFNQPCKNCYSILGWSTSNKSRHSLLNGMNTGINDFLDSLTKTAIGNMEKVVRETGVKTKGQINTLKLQRSQTIIELIETFRVD